MDSQLDSILGRVSSRFAAELRDLTHAIERGQDITPRLRVLREIWRTWQDLADVVAQQNAVAVRSRG